MHLEQNAAAATISSPSATTSSCSDAKNSFTPTSSDKGGKDGGIEDNVDSNHARTGKETTTRAPPKEGIRGIVSSFGGQSKGDGGDGYEEDSSKQDSCSSYRGCPGPGRDRDASTGTGERDHMGGASAEVAQSAAQMQQDQRDRQLQQRQTRTTAAAASSPSSTLSAENEEGGHSLARQAGMHIPYAVEYLHSTGSTGSAGPMHMKHTTSVPSVRLRYTVPQDL